MPRDSWQTDATAEATSSLRREVVEYICARDIPPEVVTRVELALSEAVSNAALHAYDADGSGSVRVSVHIDHRARAVHVEVSDDGRGLDAPSYNPGAGFGLTLVRAAASDVDVGRSDTGGTHLAMSFALPEAGQPGR